MIIYHTNVYCAALDGNILQFAPEGIADLCNFKCAVKRRPSGWIW